MSTFDKLVTQIWGAEELAAYSGATTPEEVRLKLLDVIAKSAFNNLRAYSNCCRSTLLAVRTHLRLPDPGTIQASSAFAGGIAGTGETCGSVLGGLMAIGQALGSDGYHEVERDVRATAAAKAFVESFQEMVGSTRCYGVQEASSVGVATIPPNQTRGARPTDQSDVQQSVDSQLDLPQNRSSSKRIQTPKSRCRNRRPRFSSLEPAASFVLHDQALPDLVAHAADVYAETDTL